MKYDPQIHHWNPWSIPELCQALTGYGGRWWLSGGMAVEHRVGRIVRVHNDLDISVCHDGLQPLLAVLGDSVEPWTALDGHLNRLTTHSYVPELRNIWLADADKHFVLQVNIEDGNQTHWAYARCPQIQLPWPEAVTLVERTPTGAISLGGAPVFTTYTTGRDRPCATLSWSDYL